MNNDLLAALQSPTPTHPGLGPPARICSMGGEAPEPLTLLGHMFIPKPGRAPEETRSW